MLQLNSEFWSSGAFCLPWTFGTRSWWSVLLYLRSQIFQVHDLVRHQTQNYRSESRRNLDQVRNSMQRPPLNENGVYSPLCLFSLSVFSPSTCCFCVSTHKLSYHMFIHSFIDLGSYEWCHIQVEKVQFV